MLLAFADVLNTQQYLLVAHWYQTLRIQHAVKCHSVYQSQDQDRLCPLEDHRLLQVSLVLSPDQEPHLHLRQALEASHLPPKVSPQSPLAELFSLTLVNFFNEPVSYSTLTRLLIVKRGVQCKLIMRKADVSDVITVSLYHLMLFAIEVFNISPSFFCAQYTLV